MQATFWFYIIVGLLTIVPLILFNVNRVFVRKKPEPMKVNWVRGVVILLLCGFLVFFLFSAYNWTLHARYEIALERVATEHAEVLLGKKSVDEFKTFLRENGTENIEESLENLEIGALPTGDEIRFQLGNQCIPRYWTEWDGMVSYKGLLEDCASLDLTIYTDESAAALKEAMNAALFESATKEEILSRYTNVVKAYRALEDVRDGVSAEISTVKPDETFVAAVADLPDVYVWQGSDVITLTNDGNPIYLMYRLDYDGKTNYYAVRMINTDEGWCYDWIGVPNEQQQQSIKMPTEKNGKWYSVTR